MKELYTIENVDSISSPSIVVYTDLVIENIEKAIAIIGNKQNLRPHIKTNKTKEICELLKTRNIDKFKASTIAECDLLGQIQAKDCLLAYQLTPDKFQRFINLILNYKETHYSSVFDNIKNLYAYNEILVEKNLTGYIYIDINVGMNRTGIDPENVISFFEEANAFSNIVIEGFHIYDGHIRESNIEKRIPIIDDLFNNVDEKICAISKNYGKDFKIVAGGSPSFPVHALRKNVECSPGTFVFWDWKYENILPDLPFQCALLVVTRISSIINDELICLDLGHKSIASENPFPRVEFLNIDVQEWVSQNEEHLVIRVKSTKKMQIGDVIYCIPQHVCPTVALHQDMKVIKDNRYIGEWKVVARNRKLVF